MTDRQHRLLVVGVGSIGERHVRCFQNTGRVEVSICELNDSLREQIGQRYKIERSYSDLSAALAEPHDAALVAAPADWHIRLSQQIADAGVHLLIEKPLAITLDGIEALRQTIANRKLTAAVAYVYRAHPVLTEMKREIASGRFGRPLELIAVAGQHFPTYRPAYREIYYKDHATGGGAIQDALTHVLNAGEWLVGPIDRLVADAAHLRLEGVQVEDTVHLLARHGDVMASYSLNQHQAPNENTITVVCENGTVRFEAHHNRWRWTLGPEDPWQDEPADPMGRDTLFVRQAEAFLDVIEQKAGPLCSFDEGLQTLQVNRAVLDSVKTGTWMNVGQITRAVK